MNSIAIGDPGGIALASDHPASPWSPAVPELVVRLNPDGIRCTEAKDLVVDFRGGCTEDAPPWEVLDARLKQGPTGTEVIHLPVSLFRFIVPASQPSPIKTRALLRFDTGLHNELIDREDLTAFALADRLNGGRLELDVLVGADRSIHVLPINLRV